MLPYAKQGYASDYCRKGKIKQELVHLTCRSVLALADLNLI